MKRILSLVAFAFLLTGLVACQGVDLNRPLFGATTAPIVPTPAPTRPSSYVPYGFKATTAENFPPTPVAPVAKPLPPQQPPQRAGPLPLVRGNDTKGRQVTLLQGFDLNEFGGNDANCTRTELDSIHIGEVVGSQSEGCLAVIEWSLKVEASTVLAGTYALKPGEWFYIPLAVSGINDRVRIVGTLWYLPKGRNSHMFAADLAGDRDQRDGTTSIVGLSPTDDYVVRLANSLLGK